MPKTTGILPGTVGVNGWGGYYESGRSYQLRDKVWVARLYEKHADEVYPKFPSITNKVAREAKVSRNFVRKIKGELEDGAFVDLEVAVTEGKATSVCGFLDIE
jgi:hypothetical protein